MREREITRERKVNPKQSPNNFWCQEVCFDYTDFSFSNSTIQRKNSSGIRMQRMHWNSVVLKVGTLATAKYLANAIYRISCDGCVRRVGSMRFIWHSSSQSTQMLRSQHKIVIWHLYSCQSRVISI